jgi:PhoH-like ATPase
MQKSFFLDTNIILDSPEHINTLSDGGNNIIIICDTVLDEIDAKKSGFDIINYNAREFNRFCDTASIVEDADISRTARRIILYKDNIILHFVSLLSHEYNEHNTDKKILNDRRIIETAQKIAESYPGMTVLSNDIAFRTRASIEKLKVDPLKANSTKIDDLEFFKTITLDYDIKLPANISDFKDVNLSVSGFEFINTETGKPVYGYKEGTMIYPVDDTVLAKQNCIPINIRQKVLSHMMLSSVNDIVILLGASGSGKNLIATSAACALRDMKNTPYEKIVYIRKTITSVDNKQEELGFLPGDLDAKMSGYLKPLYTTVETLIKRKFKQFKGKSKEEIESKVKEFMSEYNIQYEYEGFLRGGTISDAIVILDEFANDSQASAKLILTRIGENCKVFILGDINQIDNPYLNKSNNGLAYMLNKTNEVNEYGVNIVGMKLTETVRSKIAKYADSWK